MHKTSEWLFSYNSEAAPDDKKLTSSKAQTISITGGKGGVGKTSISLKLSRELVDQGYKVLLIDCDTNLSNTAIKLGLPIENKFYSLVTAQSSFDDCLYKDGRFHLLSASNGCLELFDSSLKIEEIIIDILNEHENEYDYVLLDCPAGLQKECLVLNAYCDKRIMVVNPDRSSITDTYSLIKILRNKYGVTENHLIVNKYETYSQFNKVVSTISETVESFLGGRTVLLGGIERLNTQRGKFDSLFFAKGGKNDLHKNILKVVKKLTDELSTPEKAANPIFASQKRVLEQEVR